VSRLRQSTETEDRQMSTASWIVDGILVPDIILPSQHFDSRTRCLEPERRLMLAVLSDAVRCFRMGAASERGPRRRLFSDAEWWLFCEKGSRPFSVQYICDALDVDPSLLRRELLRWGDRELAGGRASDDSPPAEWAIAGGDDRPLAVAAVVISIDYDPAENMTLNQRVEGSSPPRLTTYLFTMDAVTCSFPEELVGAVSSL